ncbi:hypothetical protein A3D07_03730 [Candidatus Curtissbacteria bacterium RIFCSPHIGHO2_02_FULL_42_15]|uniref:Uncharacterized protein n=1 Tax=Candidatus Curtissbacteria bacterium RIFCSPHIGHO2_02_FULL_42_15 TaxID=1797716 RepID=A0A1F5GCZ8_9BACT|nr:MAG: hypothetical protein A3D07_03730 [Candidatus Curtissbacteria bacterium RIFCSPHIGHO2_02_FULL_42_15]
MDQPKTIGDLDRLIEQKSTAKPIWPYVVFGLIFPPVSFVISLIRARRDSVLDLFLSTFIIANSLLVGLELLLILILSRFNLIVNFAASLDQEMRLDISALLISAFIGIIVGVYLRSKATKYKLGSLEKIIILIITIAQYSLIELLIIKFKQ